MPRTTYRSKALRREMAHFASEVARTGHAISRGAGTLEGWSEMDATTYTISGGGIEKTFVLLGLPEEGHADQLLDLVNEFIAAHRARQEVR